MQTFFIGFFKCIFACFKQTETFCGFRSNGKIKMLQQLVIWAKLSTKISICQPLRPGKQRNLIILSTKFIRRMSVHWKTDRGSLPLAGLKQRLIDKRNHVCVCQCVHVGGYGCVSDRVIALLKEKRRQYFERTTSPYNPPLRMMKEWGMPLRSIVQSFQLFRIS